MPDDCFPPYNITMEDCSLVYNGMEFEYHSVDKCDGNLQNYQIQVTDGTEQCTVTNSNQNFKIKTTECIYDTNGVSSATFIASPSALQSP
jgi:type 1 fimbria pilin